MQATRRHLLVSLPFALALVGGCGFYETLRRMQLGTYSPRSLPSPLIGHHVPAFELPGIDGHSGFSSTDLLTLKQPVLVNWFASWCVPCQQEAGILQQLAESGIAIWGIAYQDKPADLASYLRQYGATYQHLAVDESGLTAINWGVYGVPETYLIDKTGIVRSRYAEPLNSTIINQELIPLLGHYS